MMKKKLSAGMAAAVLLLAAAPAVAVDAIAVEAGSGDSTDMARIAIQWDWSKRWFEGAEWHVGGYWDLSLGHWRSDALPGQNRDITEIGLTPVFRLQRNRLEGAYLEAAVGFHLLSRTTIGDKRLGTRFQFGDRLGLGYRFGARSAWDLGYRFQHLSNGGIKKPNNGINFHQVRLQHHFK
ncbi:MAG: acyloxyacyl hydrolase [Betaproteobacteria bacterium]|nr:acyloxyacyl hydrolase [Betaproteobacteria bacterium]